MTKWLDPMEQRAWRAIVALMTRLPGTLDTQLQRESGITHFEYWVLTLLSEEPGHQLRMSELAHKANASLSRLSHVVSKLERMGWAQRSVTEGRRGVLAVLTDSGYLKVIEAAPGYLAAVRHLVFDGLDTADTTQLAELSEQLSTHLAGALKHIEALSRPELPGRIETPDDSDLPDRSDTPNHPAPTPSHTESSSDTEAPRHTATPPTPEDHTGDQPDS